MKTLTVKDISEMDADQLVEAINERIEFINTFIVDDIISRNDPTLIEAGFELSVLVRYTNGLLLASGQVGTLGDVHHPTDEELIFIDEENSHYGTKEEQQLMFDQMMHRISDRSTLKLIK